MAVLVFDRALATAAGEPAAWIDEVVTPMPKNIYGVTKLAPNNSVSMFTAHTICRAL